MFFKKDSKGFNRNSAKRSNYQSLKWHLVLSIVPVLLIATIGIMMSVYLISRQTMINTTDQLLTSQSETAAAEISGWADKISTSVDFSAALIEDGVLSTQKEISDYITSNQDKFEYCNDGLYVVFNDTGLMLDCDGYAANISDMSPSLLSEDWYQFGFSQSEVGFDACSMYEEDGWANYSVSITRQLLKDGTPIGIIATDAYLAGLSNLLKDFQNGTSNTLLLDSKSAMIIAATQNNYMGYVAGQGDSFADSILNDMEKGAINTRYQQNGETYFTSAVPVAGTPWYLVSYVDRTQALSALDPLLYASVVGIIILAVLIIIIVLRVVSSRMKPLVRAKDVLTTVADGDFTVDIPEMRVRKENEITEITKGLKNLVSSLRSLLNDVDETSDLVGRHSLEFSEMAGSLNEDTTEESSALQELTSNINQITDSIQLLAEHASSLASLSATTRTDSISANTKMEETVLASQKTAADIRSISASMQSTESSMTELSRLVQAVQDNTLQINSITEVIKSIASQTNLLSLNASIEAARAGEAGRGFAVVAEEIKHLAEDSSRNAEEITAHINSITELISTTAASTQQSLAEVVENAKLTENLSAAFDEMTHTLNETSRVLSTVNSNIEQVADISTSIAAISEEQAASSEEVLSTTLHIDELVARTKDRSDALSNGTTDLTSAAERLKDNMNKFTL